MLDDTLFFPSIDSTNLEAYRIRDQYAGKNILLIAKEQTAGKGRLDRNWESKPGLGLWASLFLSRPEHLGSDLQYLSLLTGIVIQHAIRDLLGPQTQLKWPNDIMIGARKCGGILTEIQWKGSEPASAIIGFGINLAHRPEDFSPQIREFSTSLSMVGATPPDSRMLAENIVDEFFDLFQLLDQTEDLVRVWNSLAWKLDEQVLWEQGTSKITGRFQGVNRAGHAQILTDRGIETINAGEIRWTY